MIATVLASLLYLSEPSRASGAVETVREPETENVIDEAARQAVEDSYEKSRTERSTLSRDALPMVAGNAARLLKALNIQLKTFEPTDKGDLGLGFEYHIAKSLLRSSDSSAWSLEFVADGNVAFEQSVNPDDFLATSLRARWFGTKSFGTRHEVSSADLIAFDPVQFASAAQSLAKLTTAEQVRSDPVFADITKRYYEGYQNTLPPELVWDFDVHAGMESNQDFSSRQQVFGASLGGRLVSWNPESSLSRLNPFDFPGAALRWLAGEEDFRPSGEAYPTIVAGLDLVDASKDDQRSAITDDDSFLRARVEAGLKTRVYSTDDEQLFLSVGWRFYQEIDAPAAVKRGDFDRSSHLQMRLDLPKGWSLTYAAGKLPLDGQDDSTFALGFNVNF